MALLADAPARQLCVYTGFNPNHPIPEVPSNDSIWGRSSLENSLVLAETQNDRLLTFAGSHDSSYL